LGYQGVWWLDYDSFAPVIQAADFASRLAPLSLALLNGVFSLDIDYVDDVRLVNSGIFYLSNSAWSMNFLHLAYYTSHKPVTDGGGGCARHDHWEQCGVQWYIGNHRTEFAIFPLNGTARCTIVRHGRLQTFPHHAPTHHDDALLHHFAGHSMQRRVELVAKKLARSSGKHTWLSLAHNVN
jgi:hypothetical protein